MNRFEREDMVAAMVGECVYQATKLGICASVPGVPLKAYAETPGKALNMLIAALGNKSAAELQAYKEAHGNFINQPAPDGFR